MKYGFSVSFILVIVFSAEATNLAQQPQCDKDCVRTVRGLLKDSYRGFSSSFGEKSNSGLGDKVGLAILYIYRGKTLYKPDNIRTFLPVIRASFEYPDLIENAHDKNPQITISLLRQLKRRVKDHFLNREITETLYFVLFKSGKLKEEVTTGKN